jgi:GNAT superfamily N-acetyltransferase
MEPLTDLSTTALARAVEENEIELLLALGRAGGGEERNDSEIAWVIGGSPIAYHNCVVRADLASEKADAAIAASRDLMRAKGVAGSWHVGPSMRPSDMGKRLEAHGFKGGPEPGMAADLEMLADVAMPAGLQVQRVTSPAGLDGYRQVLSLGFGEGPTEAAWVCKVFERIGLEDNSWHHFLGLLDGEPVATASVFLAAGVAGLYFVCTVPAHRGRGIGAAISHVPLASARDLGYRIGVLGASSMGYGVYERLGFRDVCDVQVYEWSPPAEDEGEK